MEAVEDSPAAVDLTEAVDAVSDAPCFSDGGVLITVAVALEACLASSSVRSLPLFFFWRL